MLLVESNRARIEHRVDGPVVAQLILRDRPFLCEHVDLRLHLLELVRLLPIHLLFRLQLRARLRQNVAVVFIAILSRQASIRIRVPLVVLLRTPTGNEASLTVDDVHGFTVCPLFPALVGPRHNLGLLCEERVDRVLVQIVQRVILHARREQGILKLVAPTPCMSILLLGLVAIALQMLDLKVLLVEAVIFFRSSNARLMLLDALV